MHRLDSLTGGLLILAKVAQAESKLKTCFAQRSCQKRYRAILFGKVTAESLAPYEFVVGDDCNDNVDCNAVDIELHPTFVIDLLSIFSEC